MAITRRITVKQKDDTTESVAFLSDVTLDGITGSGLVTVTGDKSKVVSTDANKLTLGTQGDVKVVTPLELSVNTTPTVTGNKLYNIEGNLYWNGKKVGVMDPGEVPVSEETFNAHVNNEGAAQHVSATEKGQLEATNGEALATQSWASRELADKDEFDALSSDVTTIESNYVGSVTGDETGVVKVAFTTTPSATGKAVTTAVTVTNATQDDETKALSGTGLVTGEQAQAAIDEVIGEWNPESTITGKVKTAIEANAAKIAALEGNHFIVVSQLPPVEEGKFNVIYLVPNEGDPDNTKDEYILIKESESATPQWEQIGTTKVDLTNYFTKAETTSAISTAVGDLSGTVDTDTASDGGGFVTVGLTGTVGNHGLSVTTSDIAKASEVGNVANLTTTDKSTVVAAVNEVAGKASSAVQTVSSGDENNIQIEQDNNEVTVTPIGTLADLLAYCAIADA